MNVAARLKAFESHRPAVIVAATGRLLTFGGLDAASDALAAGLMSIGLTSQRVAVMAPPSLDFFTLVFALFKAAAVPVMIDPGMGAKNVGLCLAEAEPAAFVAVPKGHLARRLFRWCRGALSINVGGGKFFCHHSTASLKRERKPFMSPDVKSEDLAAILYTSGSTGVAKGVEYTHGIFHHQVEMLKAIYGIKPGEIDLCTFPLFALFGPALGMTCIVPTMDFTRPATIDAKLTTATINRYGVTNLFGSPAVIRRLAAQGEMLPILKRAISAGAPARLADVKAFAVLVGRAEALRSPTEPANDNMPTLCSIPSGFAKPQPDLQEHPQLFTPYGATEALPVANIGSDELLQTQSLTDTGHGICIGRPVAGMSVHIIPISDGPVRVFDPSTCLSPGEIGEFVVRGPVVTHRYWKREAATSLAKMTDPATGETLHRMGDVGYYDAGGRLWFCGRKSHRVVTESGTLYTDQVEPVFNAMVPSARTALVGVTRGGRTEPVLVCEPHKIVNLAEHLRSQPPDHPYGTRIQTILLYDRPLFPMDPRHNSKIYREKLAEWAGSLRLPHGRRPWA